MSNNISVAFWHIPITSVPLKLVKHTMANFLLGTILTEALTPG